MYIIKCILLLGNQKFSKFQNYYFNFSEVSSEETSLLFLYEFLKFINKL